MEKVRLSTLMLLFALAVVQSSALHAAERVALVIGNGEYEHAVELPNPRNDAEDISATLTGLGFEVIKGIDLDRSGMEGKIREFSRAVGQAKLALFFYAGHGMQVNGRNFLIPIDAELADSTALDFEAIDADQVFRHMGSADRVALAFLDACRNNPLARRFARTLGPSRSASVGEGLAAPSTAGTGLFIGFATAPNDVALDGEERNSPFTQALLKHLASPGLEIQQMMTRVKAEVWEATHGDQQPWHSSDLRSEVYLLPDQTANLEQKDPFAAEFDIARRLNTKEAWEAFLDVHGGETQSLYVRLAEAELAKLALAISPALEELPLNQPLPRDVPVDLEVLKMIETEPFFANAPPVRMRSYATATTYDTNATSNYDPMSIRYEMRGLRRGIVELDFHGVTSEDGSVTSEFEWRWLAAANGLFRFGERRTFTSVGSSEEPTTNLSKVTVVKIEQLKGRIFPLTVGNRFGYRLRQSESPPVSIGDTFVDASCEVTKALSATLFHRDLNGDALVVQCEIVQSFTKYDSINRFTLSYVFVVPTGTFIQVDTRDADVLRGLSGQHTVLTDVVIDR